MGWVAKFSTQSNPIHYMSRNQHKPNTYELGWVNELCYIYIYIFEDDNRFLAIELTKTYIMHT